MEFRTQNVWQTNSINENDTRLTNILTDYRVGFMGALRDGFKGVRRVKVLFAIKVSRSGPVSQR